MAEASLTPALRRPVARDFVLLVAVLVCAIAALFYRSFSPELVLFSNDGPLGLVSAQSGQAASTISGLFTGYWQDLNWLGIEEPSVLPSFSWLFYLVFGNPVVNAKFYAPVSLIFLGFCAWLFFRQLGFRNSVCVLGGLAAALNMNSFSNACWGLPSRALTQAAMFLSLAALQSGTLRHFWLKAVLAGVAVGFGIMEGFDTGALYSLFIAAFAFFAVLISGGQPRQQQVIRGMALVGVVALSAGWCSAHALHTLIGTQITGVAGMQQDVKSKEQRWNEATTWSLPKIETSRVLVPGLFGYRMDPPGPSQYWGAVGQVPGTTQTRHSGSGEYAGVLVVLLAAWAVASGFRKKGSSLTQIEKSYVKFWAVAALIALVLAWGRHAPFYRIVYSLPYFSTIRNPIKFMHMFQLCLLVLFGFGLEEIFRGRIVQANPQNAGPAEQLKSWWKNVNPFERKWTYGAIGFGILSLLVTFIYISSNREMTQYLTTAGFGPDQIPKLLDFSVHELWYYLGFYIISLFVIMLALSGWMAGPRWKVAVILFGAILFIDLARANLPWIQYYNYKERYSTNPVLDILRDKAFECRTTFKVAPFSQGLLVDMRSDEGRWWPSLYSTWLQNQFQYFNIAALEPIQMPRTPEMDLAFAQTLVPHSTNDTNYIFGRLWELTSTRYFVGQRGFDDVLNNLDNGRKRVRINTAFNFAPKASANKQQGGFGIDDITTDLTTNGNFNIMEFTGALPRVKLFNAWQIPPNDETTLQILRAQDFDPAQKVLVAPGESLPSAGPVSTNATSKADFTKYAPKEFEVATESHAAGVLLVNDKYSPNWKVWVDGKPEKLLRCNFIMRGVYLPAGPHKVEFKYRPPVNSLYVTLSAMAAAVGLLGFLAFSRRELPKAS
jgi:hypothetical protein